MRRATVRALRSARRHPLRRSANLIPRSDFLPISSQVLGCRSITSSRQPSTVLQASSSMYIRRFSFALVSGLVGYGAWYGYKGGPDSDFPAEGQSVTTTATRSYTTSPVYQNPKQTPLAAEQAVAAQRPDRQVVVVSADNIYTGKIEGSEPLSKLTGDTGQKVLEMLTPEQATATLRKNEESYFVNRGRGVVRYDVVQIPSNNPIEDDHSEKIVEIAEAEGQKGSDWMFWGVYDGHSGWTTSAKLRQVLINYVARELNTTYRAVRSTAGSDTIPTIDAIQTAMKTGFNKLDDEIVHANIPKVFSANSKLVAAELLAPALSGACALLSFYDTRSKLLHVACTGDSRAVLGRRSPTTKKWVARPLSTDQTGSNPDEADRVRSEHPGEERDVIRHGRILGGLEPSRAFGDATYKWTRDVSLKLKDSFFGRTPSALLKTPPYVTAEPVVTSTKIQPESGDFVVMATDGLWEMLTNEEVVGLVGQWIEKQSSTTGDSTANSWLNMFKAQQKGLPVEHTAGKGDMDKDGQKTPIRQRQWGVEGGEDQKFVAKDANVATHLVRNALGGKNEEMVRALLTLTSPYSRRYRDDLTVEVIFFGVPSQEGNAEKVDNSVVMNMAASAPQPVENIKAKL